MVKFNADNYRTVLRGVRKASNKRLTDISNETGISRFSIMAWERESYDRMPNLYNTFAYLEACGYEIFIHKKAE